jgi:hypothetical protein
MIITPKQPRDGKTVSRLGKLVPYMLRVKGEERCTWYMAGNLEGLDRREDAELAFEVTEVLRRAPIRRTSRASLGGRSDDRRRHGTRLSGWLRAVERVGSQHSPGGRRGTISGTYCSVTGLGLRREALGEVSAT